MRHKYMRNQGKDKQETRPKSKASSCFLSSLAVRGLLHAWHSTAPVMTHGSAISPLYHFTLSDGTPLSAQTRCKFCCPPNPDVQPFIMGIHTIDRYCVKNAHTHVLSTLSFSLFQCRVAVLFPQWSQNILIIQSVAVYLKWTGLHLAVYFFRMFCFWFIMLTLLCFQ